jgi:hypothetical protein
MPDITPLDFAETNYADDPIAKETFLAAVLGSGEMNPNRVISSNTDNPWREEFKMSATTAKQYQTIKGSNAIPEEQLTINEEGFPTFVGGRIPIASRYTKTPQGWQRDFITKVNNEFTIPGITA